jgi:hypothetical protein
MARVTDGTAEDSDETSVTVPQMSVPQVEALRGLEKYESGEFLGPTENVTVYCEAPEGGKVVYRMNNAGEWQDFPLIGLVISTDSVCVMRTETAEDKKILASETVSLIVRKADMSMTIGGVGADIALRSGWNLISLPMTLTAKSGAELPRKVGTLFGMGEKTIMQVETVEGQVGYWLFVSDAERLSTLTLYGVRSSAATPAKGWSLGGASVATKADSVWEWTGKGFRPANRTVEGRGYLIFKE